MPFRTGNLLVLLACASSYSANAVNASKQTNRQQPFIAIPGTICFGRTSAAANSLQVNDSDGASYRGWLATECALYAKDCPKWGFLTRSGCRVGNTGTC
jgi:hypothetical protein